LEIRFRSIEGLSKWIIRFSIACIVLEIIILVSLICEILLQSNTRETLENIEGVIFIFLTMIFTLLTILILKWYYRAVKNIWVFGAKQVTRPIMSIVWWFIPVMNFYMPYDVSQQIWKTSNPQNNLESGTEWKDIAGSKLIHRWWILGVLSITGQILIGMVAGLVIGILIMTTDFEYPYPTHPNGMFSSPDVRVELRLAGIGSLILFIISQTYFIKMIRQISTWQNEKFKSRLI